MSKEEIALELTKAVCSGDNTPMGTADQIAKTVADIYKAMLKQLDS